MKHILMVAVTGVKTIDDALEIAEEKAERFFGASAEFNCEFQGREVFNGLFTGSVKVTYVEDEDGNDERPAGTSA